MFFTQGFEDLQPDHSFASEPDEPSVGVILPPIACPLRDQDLAELRNIINVTRPSESYGRDIYLDVLNYVIQHTS